MKTLSLIIHFVILTFSRYILSCGEGNQSLPDEAQIAQNCRITEKSQTTCILYLISAHFLQLLRACTCRQRRQTFSIFLPGEPVSFSPHGAQRFRGESFLLTAVLLHSLLARRAGDMPLFYCLFSVLNSVNASFSRAAHREFPAEICSWFPSCFSPLRAARRAQRRQVSTQGAWRETHLHPSFRVMSDWN